MQKSKIIYISVLIILILGAFLRFYKLEEAPLPVNQDELSNIYDGFSIAQTGADRWGNKYPFLLRAFGDADNRPPLYSWICAASIKIFGYSITAGRAPAGLIGILSLLFLFLVSTKIGGELFGFISLLLATFSPWHLLFSRMALEAVTMPSFFMIFSVWLWLKTKENPTKHLYIILLGFTIGFGVNAYQSTKLIFFILAILVLIDIFKTDSYKIKRPIIAAVFMFIGAYPQIHMAVFEPHKFFSRATYTMMEFSFSFEYFSNLLQNIFSNISPDYLFLSFGYNNMSIARLLKIEMIFFYFGVFVFYLIIKQNSFFKAWHLYLLMFLAVLPSATTMNNPHALRASSLVILYPMVSAAGFCWVLDFVKNQKIKIAFVSLFVIGVLANSTQLMWKYLNDWNLKNYSHQSELVEMSKKINLLKNDYSKIHIQNLGIQPYIYIASYCEITPKDFQKMKKVYENQGLDKFIQLDKYYFFDKENFLKESLLKNGKNLIVFNSKKVDLQLVDILDTRSEKFYFYIY